MTEITDVQTEPKSSLKPVLDSETGLGALPSSLADIMRNKSADSPTADALARNFQKAEVERVREEHFRSIQEKDYPSVVIVYGPSGSGKTTVATMLQKQEVAAPVTRLITRERRASDVDTDREWQPTDQADHGLDNVLFAYGKYGSHYGFQVSNVLELVKAGETPIVVLGDASKVPPFIDAVERLIPSVPVTLIRLDAPSQIVEARLSKGRKEAYEGEAAKRIAANKRLANIEEPQLSAIDKIYGQKRLINVSREEVRDMGLKVAGVRALTPERVRHALDEANTQASAFAAARAEHIIRDREIEPNDPNIPAPLVDVMATKLVPEAKKMGIRPALKGGLAVAIYLSDTYQQQGVVQGKEQDWGELRPLRREVAPPSKPLRPVSMDIDWTTVPSDEELGRHQELIQALSGKEHEFEDAMSKPVFHSRKIQSSTLDSNGEPVELDMIAISRVQPENQGFTFEFPYTEDLAVYRRTVTMPDGGVAELVPPEFLALEKLLAGRGAEQNKFDLYDAAGLLTTQPIHFPIVERIIESQRFSPSLDTDIQAEKLSDIPSLPDLHSTLRSLPITDPSLIRILSERTLAMHEMQKDGGGSSIFSIAPLEWTPTTLKRAAFVDALLRSIDKIEENMYVPLENVPGSPTLGEAFGRESIREAITDLKRDLMFYAEYHLGRPDVWIRRGLSPVVN